MSTLSAATELPVYSLYEESDGAGDHCADECDKAKDGRRRTMAGRAGAFVHQVWAWVGRSTGLWEGRALQCSHSHSHRERDAPMPRNVRVVNEVYIPDPLRLEREREANTRKSSKKGYGGDWKMMLLVTTLQFGIYTGFVVYMCMPWLHAEESLLFPVPHGLALPVTLFGAVFTLLSVISYWVVVLTDPGFPAPHFSPLPRADGLAAAFDPLSPTLRMRWCDTCSNYKPPRTHHCGKCGVCVLRGDHHCVFTIGCIGVRNHKAFCLFLLYQNIIIWEGCCTDVLVFDWLQGDLEFSQVVWENAPLIALTATCIGLHIFVGKMFRDQAELILANVTTIEKRDLRSWKYCWEDDVRDTLVQQRLVCALFPLVTAFFELDNVFADFLVMQGLAFWDGLTDVQPQRSVL